MLHSTLQDAVERGDLNAVTALYKLGDARGPALMRTAVAHGHEALIRFFRSQGLPIEADYYSIALAHEHWHVLDMFCEAGFPPQQSLMTQAVDQRSLEAVRFLHQHGLRLTREGVLEPALATGSFDIVAYCVEVGSLDVSDLENRGFELVSDPRTALIVEALGKNGRCQAAAAVASLARHLHEADFALASDALADIDPLTAINYLLWRRDHFEHSDARDKAMITELFERVGEAKLALRASVVGDEGLIQALLRADGAFPEKERVRALRLAAANGQLRILEILHEAGVSLSGETADAIVLAAANGRLAVVDYLIQHGCDPAHDHWAAGPVAMKGGHLEVLKRLHETGLPLAEVADLVPGLITAKGALDVLGFFEEETGQSGALASAKVAAALRAHDHRLLQAALAPTPERLALDQLMGLAAELGDLAAVQILAGPGASLACDAAAALLAAADRGHLDILRFLISRGADPNVEDGFALAAAAENGHLESVRFLVETGVRASALTPVCLAGVQFNGHADVYTYLTSMGADGLADHRPQIDAMMAEVASGPEAYRPSQSRQNADEQQMKLLRLMGMERFKRTYKDDRSRSVGEASGAREITDPRHVRAIASRITLFDPDRTQKGRGPLVHPDLRFFDGKQTGFALPLWLARRIERAAYRQRVAQAWAEALATDTLGLAQRLSEPRIGAPIESWLDDRLVSLDLARSIIETNAILGGLDLGSLGTQPRIMQIGAGYGGLIHVLAQAIDARFVIVDTAPALQIATYYLKALFPEKTVFAFRPFRSFHEIADELSRSDIAFFSMNQIEMFPDRIFDMGISIDLSQQMQPANIPHIFGEIGRTVRHTIYVKDDGQSLSRPDAKHLTPDAFGLDDAWAIDVDRTPSRNGTGVERRLRRRQEPAPAAPAAAEKRAPRIALLLVNYNDSRFLHTSLEGVLGQTRPFDEIIIVDDGSNDDTERVVRRFQQCSDRIRFVPLGQRRGQYHAVQRAIREATSEFVVLAAADDLLLPNFVATKLAVHQSYRDVGLAFSRLCTWVDGTTTFLEYHGGNHGVAFELGSSPLHLSPADLRARLKQHYVWISGNTVVARRRLLIEQGGFEQSLRWHSDWFGYYVVAIRGGVVGVPRTLAMMRERAGTYSGVGMHDPKEQRRVLDALLDRLGEDKYFDVRAVFRETPSLLAVCSPALDMIKVLAVRPRQIRLLLALIRHSYPEALRWFKAQPSFWLRWSKIAPRTRAERLTSSETSEIWNAFISKDYDKVVQLADEALARGRKDPDLHYFKALSLQAKGERFKEALRHFNIALKLRSDRAWTLTHRGTLRLAMGDRKGRRDLARAARLKGDAAREARAKLDQLQVADLWSKFNAGQRDEAIALAEALIKAETADPGVHLVLGLCLHDNPHRCNEALAHYDLALKKGLDPGWACFHRGRLLIALGEPLGRSDLLTLAKLDNDPGREARAALAKLNS